MDAHKSLAAALQHAADAIAVLDCGGRIKYANFSFRSLLQTLDLHYRADDERPLDAAVFKPLRMALGVAAGPAGEHGGAAQRCQFSISYGMTVLDYVAAVSCIAAAGDSLQTGVPERQFLVVVREAQAPRRERVAAVCLRYGLSRAETRVLARFADGEDLAQISRSLNVSIHTVRIHMKVLLEKTACARQVALMRLLGSVNTGHIRIEI